MSAALDTTDARAELARLTDEYRAAMSSTDRNAANVGRAEMRLRRLKTERVAAYKDSARGREGAEERVEEVEEELADLEIRLESDKAAAEGALQARREVEEEIARLRKKYLPAFAEEAEAYTEQAREALRALAPHYKAAEAAWGLARSKWAPLADAIAQELDNQRKANGVYSAGADDAEASRVPGWPLPAFGSVFERSEAGALSARPPALQPDD